MQVTTTPRPQIQQQIEFLFKMIKYNVDEMNILRLLRFDFGCKYSVFYAFWHCATKEIEMTQKEFYYLLYNFHSQITKTQQRPALEK